MGTEHSRKEGLLAGELARATGVSTDTLRHYERKGVLPHPQRSSNGYRRYPASALERVSLIRRALGVGFMLNELASILRERDAGKAPCRRVRELAASKLASLEKRIGEMQQVRDELRSTLLDWDDRLGQAKGAGRVGLLESLRTPGSRADNRPESALFHPPHFRKERKP